MKYERLTERDEFGNADIIGCESQLLCGELDFEQMNRLTKALNRLAELEDKIENGTLIERYYIQEDELPNGKVWYNVCELNENYGSIKKQCATRAEAEARLAELWRKE